MITVPYASGWSFHRRAPRRLAAALVLALMPAACASDRVSLPMVTVDAGTTLSGNYLAGRHALAVQDTDTAATLFLHALQQAPDNEDLRRTAFIASLRNGRMDDALPLAKTLVEQDQQAEIALLALSIDAIKTGDASAAKTHIDALAQKNVYAFMIPLLRAWSLAGAGQTDAALEALSALSKRDGFDVMVGLHKGLILDIAGRTQAATAAFDDLTKDSPALSLRLVQLTGNFYERHGKPKQALALYETFLKNSPATHAIETGLTRVADGRVPAPYVTSAADGVAEALMGLSSALTRQNARDTAEIFTRLALHLKMPYPTAQLLLAGILESDDHLDKANAVYAAIPQDSPLSLTAKIRQADNLDRLNKTDEAIQLLNDIAKILPNDPQPMLDLGDILRRHDRFEEAVEAYDEAIKRIGTLSERHWTVLYTRAIALERSKNWPKAEKDFLRALDFNPEQPLVLNYLGYTWVEKGVHLERAEAMIRKAVELRPNDGYIVDSLGWVLYRLGRPTEAVREMERAVELRPEDPVINDHLGDVYWTVGRVREAMFQWKRALGLEPEEDLAKDIRHKIENGLPNKTAPKK